ncbi:hypothetical protein ABT061_09595 [Streptosporangium sp. NPDC002544]|uniref:hypothetical protein n=1 Tax=Streptosporangium sp. NPDC002544 TaxID=3154538 RepID=UPI003324422E
MPVERVRIGPVPGDGDLASGTPVGLLAEPRADLAQCDVATTMGVSGPRVSAIEHGEVAALHFYVEALGGRLRAVADFGDVEYTMA